MYINIPKPSSFSYRPPTPRSSPDAGPIRFNKVPAITIPHGHRALATPPTTPPAQTASPLFMAGTAVLLAKLFPASVREAEQFTTSVNIESIESNGSRTWWEGFILEEHHTGKNKTIGHRTRTLYMNAQNALTEQDRVRECIVALLDLAGEHLECDAVVMVLERGGDGGRGGNKAAAAGFGELVHSLLYVGGVVVSKPPFALDPRYVLVGIEV